MSVVVHGRKYHEDSRDTQGALALVAHRLIERVDQLGTKEGIDPRLSGIGRQMNTLSAQIDLAETSPGQLALDISSSVRSTLSGTLRKRDAGERYVVLQGLDHALKIAKNEASPFNYSPEQREQIRIELAREFSFVSTHEGMSFKIAPGENIYDTALRLHVTARDLGNGVPAISHEVLQSLGRQAGENIDGGEVISFGRLSPKSYRMSFSEQQHVLAEQRLSLPEQSRFVLGHSLQYAITGKSLCEGFPVRVSENRALKFAERGLAFVLDGRADRFSAVLGMDISFPRSR